MKVTRTDDDDDVFVESKRTVQCFSEDPKCRAERNRHTADRDSVRLIKLYSLLTRTSGDIFCLGRVEKNVVSDKPSGDCIGAGGECRQSGR